MSDRNRLRGEGNGDRAVKVGVFSLTFLIYRVKDQPDKKAAHCLDMDIVAVGDDVESAIALLKELVEDHVACAFKDNREENLYNPAPKEFWGRLLGAQRLKSDTRRMMIKAQYVHVTYAHVPEAMAV